MADGAEKRNQPPQRITGDRPAGIGPEQSHGRHSEYEEEDPAFPAFTEIEIPGKENQSRQKHIHGQAVLMRKRSPNLINTAEMLENDLQEITENHDRNTV